MQGLLSMMVQIVCLIFGITQFQKMLAKVDFAYHEFLQESREELMARRCASTLSYRLNIYSSEKYLQRLAPRKKALWSVTRDKILGSIQEISENECSQHTWHAKPHQEKNVKFPADWPNWRPRFDLPENS